MARGGGSTSDGYKIVEWPQGNPPGGETRVAGRAIRDPRIVTGETTLVLIVAGQSNACNYVNVQYTPTNAAKIDNLNPYDGGLYAAVDPLLGCESYSAYASPGNMFLQVADKLITAGVCQRVILIPIAIGGTLASLWNSVPFGDRLSVAFKRANAAGLTVSAVLWQQGEADQVAGTTQADYTASLQSVIAKPRAAGFSSPWLVAKCTYFVGAKSEPVRAAQAAVVNGTDIFAGPDTDTIIGSGRYDNGHWNATGRDAASSLWLTAIDAVF